jgi:hypothetical protein
MLRKKAAACVEIATALRAAGAALRLETEDVSVRRLEADLALRLADIEDGEGATCEAEANTADSRAAKARARSSGDRRSSGAAKRRRTS